MNSYVSSNTQAVLLLMAPLLVGKGEYPSGLFSLGEYNTLAQSLVQIGREPSDLLGPESNEIIEKLYLGIEKERVIRLLGRGFLLSQAIERWQARSIWVVSRGDAEYPKRIKSGLKNSAPVVFYGCGDPELLESGGLAIVGSRHVDPNLVEYTENIGRLAAKSHITVVSGGARGIDQASMRGALQAGGCVVGVLADGLGQLALNRDSREFLMNKQLVLISAYDPGAGFNVGNAMNRNKTIYALADAALVVSSDFETGGTWAGAIEQLGKLRLVPVFVRSTGDAQKGLTALIKKGALKWPEPTIPDELNGILKTKVNPAGVTLEQKELPLGFNYNSSTKTQAPLPLVAETLPSPETAMASKNLSEELFSKVRELLSAIKNPKTTDEIAGELKVSKAQAKEWLLRLVDEGVLKKKGRPARFSPAHMQ